MECGCVWQRSLSLENNTRVIEEIPELNRSYGGCNHWLWIGHAKATKSHILSQGQLLVTIVTIDHMLLECAVLQESRDECYPADSLNTVETIPKTCVMDSYEKQGSSIWYEWLDILCNSSLESSLNWLII